MAFYSVILQLMIEIDRTNKRILRELTKDGRITNAELANRVGLSASACLRRTQDLERLGVIKNYRAVLDQALLGIGFTAYITVGLNDHTKSSQQAFEDAITLSDEVKECHNVAGSFEYILRVETKDLPAYKVFHTDVLGTLPQVHSITTYVVMDSPKDIRG